MLKNSEYDQAIQKSQTADKPMAPQFRTADKLHLQIPTESKVMQVLKILQINTLLYRGDFFKNVIFYAVLFLSN